MNRSAMRRTWPLMMNAEIDAGEGILRRAQGEAEASRQFAMVGEQIFPRMPGNLLVGGERRERIDQAKKVGLERRVAHRPVEHDPLPIGRIEDARLIPAKLLVERAPQLLHVTFQQDFRRVRQGR